MTAVGDIRELGWKTRGEGIIDGEPIHPDEGEVLPVSIQLESRVDRPTRIVRVHPRGEHEQVALGRKGNGWKIPLHELARVVGQVKCVEVDRGGIRVVDFDPVLGIAVAIQQPGGVDRQHLVDYQGQAEREIERVGRVVAEGDLLRIDEAVAVRIVGVRVGDKAIRTGDLVPIADRVPVGIKGQGIGPGIGRAVVDTAVVFQVVVQPIAIRIRPGGIRSAGLLGQVIQRIRIKMIASRGKGDVGKIPYFPGIVEPVSITVDERDHRVSDFHPVDEDVMRRPRACRRAPRQQEAARGIRGVGKMQLMIPEAAGRGINPVEGVGQAVPGTAAHAVAAGVVSPEGDGIIRVGQQAGQLDVQAFIRRGAPVREEEIPPHA